MKLTLESTMRVIDFRGARGTKPIKCRIWEGQTESGIAVQVLIPHIGAMDQTKQKELEQELRSA